MSYSSGNVFHLPLCALHLPQSSHGRRRLLPPPSKKEPTKRLCQQLTNWPRQLARQAAAKYSQPECLPTGLQEEEEKGERFFSLLSSFVSTKRFGKRQGAVESSWSIKRGKNIVSWISKDLELYIILTIICDIKQM